MSDKNSHLVRIYSSTSAAEAHLARNFLEEHGIQARVSGDALAHAGLLSAGLVEVYAFEEQAGEARNLLENWSASDMESDSEVDYDFGNEHDDSSKE